MSTGTPPTEFEYSPLLIAPPGTLVTEKLAKEVRTMLEQHNRRESKPKPQPSHENPAMRGRMLTGTPPTEFEFSPLSISPPGRLVTERPAEKDRLMLVLKTSNCKWLTG
jgi:hypothetical protein